MFDITKSWTFDYAIKELKVIPEHMSILLLGNFGDLRLSIYYILKLSFCYIINLFILNGLHIKFAAVDYKITNLSVY
ncbi:hypothetical protein RhiirA5_354724, partial [Rhizophagus irregularis]